MNTDHLFVFKIMPADPTIPWPARGSSEISLSERAGWERRTIPVLDDGRETTMEAMCRGELAVNRMLHDDEGFAICLADSGWRISYGGRVFARCEDAMRAAEAMMAACRTWSNCRHSAFAAEQKVALKDILEAAERRGEICIDQVYPK